MKGKYLTLMVFINKLHRNAKKNKTLSKKYDNEKRKTNKWEIKINEQP